MKQHGTGALVPEMVAQEVQKGLGLFSIAKAETNLSEEALRQRVYTRKREATSLCATGERSGITEYRGGGTGCVKMQA